MYGELSHAKIPSTEAARYINDFFIVAEDSVERSKGIEGENETDVEPHMRGFDIFRQSLNEMTTGRKFFVSSDRYMGLTPTGTQLEDRICVIRGCNVPFVVRPQVADGVYLVGECYVHGLMRGEAMRCEDGDFEAITLL